jgi:hypothetical protein
LLRLFLPANPRNHNLTQISPPNVSAQHTRDRPVSTRSGRFVGYTEVSRPYSGHPPGTHYEIQQLAFACRSFALRRWTFPSSPVSLVVTVPVTLGRT